MFKVRVILLLLFCCGLFLLTGCGDGFYYVPKDGVRHETADNVVFEVKPYTPELDNYYRFGHDFTFLDFNNAFLLTVHNNSSKVIEFYPVAKAVLVDNFGRQFKVVTEPELPGVEPLSPRYKYDIENRGSYFNTPLENIDDELERLYERELYLQGQVSLLNNVKEDVATRDIRDSVISLERELLSLERRALEIKREQEIKQVKKEMTAKAIYKDGMIYPGAAVYGLLIFDSQVIKDGNYTVRIMFPEPETGKVLEFKFRLVRE
ncbi:MAG: hypothetical protein ABIH39_03775 [Candidatus Margulisiibacteriota bacterium]